MSPTLGYVFWHRPRPGVPLKEYERKLLAFQRSIKAHPPEGLVDATSFRGRASPWSRSGAATYEDWYLVRDYASLGALNQSAVGGPNARPHDEVAAESADGAGGLYRLRRAGLRLGEARFATWMSKPAGTPYHSFLLVLDKLTRDRKTDLWQRELVLGPAPEFCVHSESALGLPKAYRPMTVRVHTVAETRP
jgi:hypothetical protein